MLSWSLIGLILYFDGSLRTPRDVGFSTHRLGRMASCGTAIYDDDHKLVCLGGKSLDIVPDITSANVEYDGFLFGLNAPCLWSETDHLIVRGDCKAIIDQLNGNAVPRKLLPKHEAALKILGRIREHVTVSFQHVTRKDNKLCDSICASVMHIQEQRQLSTFHKELKILPQSAVYSECSDTSQSETMNLLNRFMASDKSLVPYSIRPRFYKEAAVIAERLKDGAALEYIGRELVQEAKFWPPEGALSKVLMTAQGILWQVQGLDLLGNKRQAGRLLQKHRYILTRFGTNDDINNAFSAGCDSLQDSDDPSLLFAACNVSERDALKTWYDEACRQDGTILQQGYWVTL